MEFLAMTGVMYCLARVVLTVLARKEKIVFNQIIQIPLIKWDWHMQYDKEVQGDWIE
jgi:hypothetical protein